MVVLILLIILVEEVLNTTKPKKMYIVSIDICIGGIWEFRVWSIHLPVEAKDLFLVHRDSFLLW